MEPAYADAPLPCEAPSQGFTLKDPLRLPWGPTQNGWVRCTNLHWRMRL